MPHAAVPCRRGRLCESPIEAQLHNGAFWAAAGRAEEQPAGAADPALQRHLLPHNPGQRAMHALSSPVTLCGALLTVFTLTALLSQVHKGGFPV